MQRISAQSNDNYQLARKVLYWVVNSVFPLNLPTIQQALAVENEDKSLDKENMPDGELLVSVCTGLIEVHRDRGIVGLVHFTTQEYFERKGHELFPEAQEDILRTCLTFLSFEEFGTGVCETRKHLKKRLQDYPFLAYSGMLARAAAPTSKSDPTYSLKDWFYVIVGKILTHYCTIARCWGHHARYTQYNPVCEELIIKFLNNYENLQHSLTFNYAITPVWLTSEQTMPALSVSLVHVASYFGLKRIVEGLLSGGAAANATTYFGTTALHSVQDAEIASLLLKSSAQVDYADRGGRTPLMHHAKNDNVVMVEKLLESGADINATSNFGYTPFQEVSINSCNLTFFPH